MRISRKARFAVSAMVRLSLCGDHCVRSLAELSIDQGISLSYLEQLFALLRQKGIVVGVRGPGGGYRLARPAADIDIASIMTAVDDKASPGKESSAKVFITNSSKTDMMWDELSARLHDFLKHISLADMLNYTSERTSHDRKVA